MTLVRLLSVVAAGAACSALVTAFACVDVTARAAAPAETVPTASPTAESTPTATPPASIPATARHFPAPFRVKANSSAGAAASEASAPSEHPLLAALRFASSAYDHAQKNVRDYTCVLRKRERIDEVLQEPQTMRAWVRRRQTSAGRVTQPFSVFLDFESPERIKHRKVLFVEGQNDGKMLVRNGGKRFTSVIVKIDPQSEAAMRESQVPITDVGFESIVQQLMTLIHTDIKLDPKATNTQVEFFKRAKVNDRVCTHVSVVHPQPSDTMQYHIANVYVDDELKVPIRIEAYGWPSPAGGKPPLLAEYTYLDLQLNVGLTDADFSLTRMERKAQP